MKLSKNEEAVLAACGLVIAILSVCALSFAFTSFGDTKTTVLDQIPTVIDGTHVRVGNLVYVATNSEDTLHDPLTGDVHTAVKGNGYPVEPYFLTTRDVVTPLERHKSDYMGTQTIFRVERNTNGRKLTSEYTLEPEISSPASK